jgi:uncharacterized protein (DUF427 family)
MTQRIPLEPGQESVWDYPRPPRVEPSSRHVQVIVDGQIIAETRRAIRVLETSHPPVYYIPPADVQMDRLTLTPRQTICEFKGAAPYWTLHIGDRSIENVAWSYQHPLPDFESIRGYLAFYPSRVDACFVDGELVIPQQGDFYGGWITSEIIGPFKGGTGTRGW